MGFALWVEDGLAWCAGTHEYKPMGVAVIAASTLFTSGDFQPDRRPPPGRSPAFRGYYASLSDVNIFLAKSRSQGKQKNFKRLKSPIKSIL
jgi:hypothetical protein